MISSDSSSGADLGQQENPCRDHKGEGQGRNAINVQQHVERTLRHHGKHGAEEGVADDPPVGIVEGCAKADGGQHRAELEQPRDDGRGAAA